MYIYIYIYMYMYIWDTLPSSMKKADSPSQNWIDVAYYCIYIWIDRI